MITFELHDYDWHYMYYIQVTLAVTYILPTALQGLLHSLLHGWLHGQLQHHGWHYVIMNIITWITWRLHNLLHTHYDFYYMACYPVSYMEHYITNCIIVIFRCFLSFTIDIWLWCLKVPRIFFPGQQTAVTLTTIRVTHKILGLAVTVLSAWRTEIESVSPQPHTQVQTSHPQCS